MPHDGRSITKKTGVDYKQHCHQCHRTFWSKKAWDFCSDNCAEWFRKHFVEEPTP